MFSVTKQQNILAYAATKIASTIRGRLTMRGGFLPLYGASVYAALVISKWEFADSRWDVIHKISNGKQLGPPSLWARWAHTWPAIPWWEIRIALAVLAGLALVTVLATRGKITRSIRWGGIIIFSGFFTACLISWVTSRLAIPYLAYYIVYAFFIMLLDYVFRFPLVPILPGREAAHIDAYVEHLMLEDQKWWRAFQILMTVLVAVAVSGTINYALHSDPYETLAPQLGYLRSSMLVLLSFPCIPGVIALIGNEIQRTNAIQSEILKVRTGLETKHTWSP